MKKRILITLAAAVVVVGGVAGMSAFEAHVINVTATIENALTVPIDKIAFGTVFPEEVFEQNFSVALSDSFKEQAQCSDLNLLQNGSFETPEVVASQQWSIFPDETADLGWSVEWESAETEHNSVTRPNTALQELHRGVNGWLAQDGYQYAELDTDWDGPGGSLSNEPALVKIYQDISTTPGRKYVLTYWFSPRPGTDSSDNTLLVRIDGAQVASHSASGGSQTVWAQYSYEFEAVGNTTKVEFAGGGTANSLGVFLDGVSLVECGRISVVDYVLRQKPKCVDNENPELHPQITHNGENFVCPAGSHIMPLLCPYLSKSEETEDGEGENDGDPVEAFHGPLTDDWTMSDTEENEVLGKLSFIGGDIDDQWLIDLHVPCFERHCAQDDVIPDDYQPDPELDGQTFGCDLWLEVTDINGVN